jgi:Zn-dependent protease with chaperone function
MRRISFLIISLAIAQASGAQQAGYKPMSYSSYVSSSKKSGYIKKLAPKYISSDKKYIAEWNTYLYDINESHAKASREKQFITESYVVNYLQGVLQPILDANHIKDNIEIVCTRYQEVNAYNIGDNRLYVNIGVLKMLENEAQLAFLLGHELSHYLLQHGQAKFRNVRDLAADKKVKEEIKDIRQAKYNKMDRASQFAAKYSYTFASYSRSQERAADSMAIVLLQPTRYDLAEGKGLMRILKQSDSDRTSVDYSRFLSGSTNALRPEILQDNRYNISFGHKRAITYEEDSLKSHPDIPQRIEFINYKVGQLGTRESSEKFVLSKGTFDSINKAAFYEIIESYDANKRYAATIYQTLNLLQQQPDNVYLIKKAAFAFKNVVLAVKDHSIQNHVPIESEANAASYNQLLRIIDRTTLPELTQLYNNFLANYSAQLNDVPELKRL